MKFLLAMLTSTRRVRFFMIQKVTECSAKVCTDITAVLEEFAALTKETSNSSDQHLFLVLDKRVQGLPWESIPTLRGRSISRIPSLSFLIDRLELSRVLSEKPPLKPSDQYQSDGFEVDPRRVYYVLNPGGDLSRTEAQFSPWLQGMKKLGWSGVIGRAPTEMEMISALEKNDLFMLVRISERLVVYLPRILQLLWPWWRRAIHTRQQSQISFEMPGDDVMGLLFWLYERGWSI